MSERIKIGETNDVLPGRRRRVIVRGRALLLLNIDGEYYVIDDQCTHAETSLAQGEVEGHVIVCPWHAARFDVRTGKALCPPAKRDLHSYTVQVEGGDIFVELP